MCIIIDASKMDQFFTDPPSEEVEPIHKWIDAKKGIVAYSTYGKLGSELKGNKETMLQDMNRDGRAIFIKEEEIKAEQKRLEKIGEHKSNDVHILALEKASGARVLYTEDNDLMDDFQNPEIINDPRGKIYSGARNKTLFLRKDLCKRAN